MEREHVIRKHIRNLNILRLTFTRLNLIAYTITKESLFSQTPWFIGIKKSVKIFFFILAAFIFQPFGRQLWKCLLTTVHSDL